MDSQYRKIRGPIARVLAVGSVYNWLDHPDDPDARIRHSVEVTGPQEWAYDARTRPDELR